MGLALDGEWGAEEAEEKGGEVDGTGYLWEYEAYDEGGYEGEEEAVFVSLTGEAKSAE